MARARSPGGFRHAALRFRLMHAGTRYTLREFLRWSRRDSYWLLAVAVVPTIAYVALGWTWIAIPWVPVGMIGTAAAFVSGFKNNASYNRLWEARQIWGAIVNASRTWGMMTRDFVRAGAGFSEEEAAATRTRLVHRHIAWLTALRYQLRQIRTWENTNRPMNVEYRAERFVVAELVGNVEQELAALLAPPDMARLAKVANRATQIAALQSGDLADLASRGVLEPNRHVALSRTLADLVDCQGRCERIKNFPYPRQFATINLFFIRLFVWLVPLGLLGEFGERGPWLVWLTVPFSFVVGWTFNALERIGESSENPFESGANDVPITALARTIEIDLREMLGESAIPAPIGPSHDILM